MLNDHVIYGVFESAEGYKFLHLDLKHKLALFSKLIPKHMGYVTKSKQKDDKYRRLVVVTSKWAGDPRDRIRKGIREAEVHGDVQSSLWEVGPLVCITLIRWKGSSKERELKFSWD